MKTTISFNVSNSSEAIKLCSMLKAYGVQNLSVENEQLDSKFVFENKEQEFPGYLINSLKKSLEQAEKGELASNDVVQKQILELCHSK